METTSLITVNEMEKMANAVAKSNLFGIKTPEQALALMCIAQAEGLHPGVVARDYHIIQGRPALKADSMLARFQSVGGKVRWIVHTDERVCAVFSHPSGGELEIDWTMERAKKAELSMKDNWKKYPRQMLRARVISEGIRAIFPGVIAGDYAVEEVQDFEEKPVYKSKKINSTVILENKSEEEVIPSKSDLLRELRDLTIQMGIKDETISKWLTKAGVEFLDDMPEETIKKCILNLKEKFKSDMLDALKDEQEAA